MTDTPSNPDAKAFIERLRQAERQLADYGSFLKKLGSQLSRSKKALFTKAAIAKEVAALISVLEGLKTEPQRLVVNELIDSLEMELRTTHRHLQENFPPALRSACEESKLDFKIVQDGYVVGPFFLVADIPKELASFEYAKALAQRDLPLNAAALVAQAVALKASLIDQPVNLPQFRKDIHEAMRVAVARRELRQPAGELRVELPVVFRELSHIRGSSGGRTSQTAAVGPYSIARFVVELKQFMQSDENLSSDQQFRLEPAVIENAKNPKKSIFIPRDIQCGYGEGTYYQAVVLQQK